ncbi:helix-turn-helix domain containing protein [Nocardia abscessus]|uniref:helix-turn-helix domain-containing protein n=1 Tax=Nocardia abscessus TaxID=120957 RepID=UPI001893BBAD|nr:helix-turn-helix domain-containing protein [Nocardia abscessus]MBF6341390.1 helix-turn-helix domain containing protein [Nocardia abscessus]
MSTRPELWLEILQAPERHRLTVTEVCRRYRISRKTYYSYLARYRAQGVAGLVPRSRRPNRFPGRSPAAVEAAVVRIRLNRPQWGARRIRAELMRGSTSQVPAISTVHAILRRNGLVGARPEYAMSDGVRQLLPGGPLEIPAVADMDDAARSRALRVNSHGAISYRKRKIQVGAQLVGETVHTSEHNGIVRVYHGHELLRELQLGPKGTYHGNGKKSPGRPLRNKIA